MLSLPLLIPSPSPAPTIEGVEATFLSRTAISLIVLGVFFGGWLIYKRLTSHTRRLNKELKRAEKRRRGQR